MLVTLGDISKTVRLIFSIFGISMVYDITHILLNEFDVDMTLTPKCDIE